MGCTCSFCHTEYEKAQEKYQKVDDEKHKIHKQIMDIGGNKLKAAESKLIMINTHIDQITGRKTKASVAKKTAQKFVYFVMFSLLVTYFLC